MTKADAATWNALYAAYVSAHHEYLEVKLMLARAPDDGSAELADRDAVAGLAAAKLEQAHMTMHKFLTQQPAQRGAAKANGRPGEAQRKRSAPKPGWRPGAQKSTPEQRLSLV
jgi:hypothetical protein